MKITLYPIFEEEVEQNILYVSKNEMTANIPVKSIQVKSVLSKSNLPV